MNNKPNDGGATAAAATTTNTAAAAAAGAATIAAGEIPRKKKISRLIPAEEALAAIEECTERSEDSSYLTESSENDNSASRRNWVNKLATQTINENREHPPVTKPPHVIKDLQPSAEETAEKGKAAPLPQQVPPQNGPQQHPPQPHVPQQQVPPQYPPKQQTPKQGPPPRPEQSLNHSHQNTPPQGKKIGKPVPQHPKSEQSITPTGHSSPGARKSGADNESSSNEDTVTTERNTDAEDEDSIQEPPKDGSNSGHKTDNVLSLSASSVQNDSQTDEGLFDFDDDFEELDTSEKEEALTWRSDPSLNLSDWTIVVKSREDEKINQFHVHKNILAVGPRKSEYFVNVFRMVGRPPGETSNNNVTEIELGFAAAKVVPNFLDFMYSNEGELDISTASATGLRHLAQFFGVRVLHKKVMEFIQKDLSLATCITYYKDVCVLRDEKLLLTIAKFCSRQIMKIEPNSPLVEVMDSYFFAKLISSPNVSSKEKKYHCSILLAGFCEKNKDKLDERQFLLLTDEKILPLIHYSAALSLLETEADLVIATSLSSLLEISNLQKRCIKELSYHWKDVGDLEAEQMTRVLRKLPASVVTELLVKSLSNAKRKVLQTDNADSSSDSSKQKKNKGKEMPPAPIKGKPDVAQVLFKKEYEMKLDKVKQEHNDELSQLKKEYENNLVRLRDMLVEKDKTIAKFWNEIKCFERLQNGHEGKLLASGRAHEASYVPELSRTPSEGILLVTKKAGPKYPIFYYKKDDLSPSESGSTSSGAR